MHYYSVFKDRPFRGERKHYRSIRSPVNGFVRIFEVKFPQAAPRSAAEHESTHLTRRSKYPSSKKITATFHHSDRAIFRCNDATCQASRRRRASGSAITK